MALLLALLASSFDAVANFVFRKNLDSKGSAHSYLLASYASSFLLAIWLKPDVLSIAFSPGMFMTGLIAGVLMVGLMVFTGKALANGPAGLTYAFQISGSIFPAIGLFLVFGPEYGFVLTKTMILGFFLVIVGLFWAANLSKDKVIQLSRIWLILAIVVATIQISLFSIMQWRCLAFSSPLDHPGIFFRCTPEQDVWYMQGLYLAAFVSQCILLKKARASCKKQEIIYGSVGGLLSGAGTILILTATTFASPIEKAVLFPLYAISTIMLCNLWSKVFYSEKVNWWAHGTCSFGILLAQMT